MRYNYIFFNCPDTSYGAHRDGYYSICVEDLETLDNVVVVSDPIHYAAYVEEIKFKEEKPICFVFCCGYENIDYMRYLKSKYPKCKIVKLHRDLVKVFLSGHPEFKSEYIKNTREIYDLLMIYDEDEAKKYSAIPFSEFESKTEVPICDKYPLSDVFFCGVMKDRLVKLIKAYRILAGAGLNVSYYLTGVPEEMRVHYPGIVYGERQLSYREMLYYTVNSRCLLEINQGGAVGYTSRFLEAVIYNKKLITDNMSIKNSKFYDARFIQCVTHVDDIDSSFLERNEHVDFNYQGEFSPIHLFDKIENELAVLDDVVMTIP